MWSRAISFDQGHLTLSGLSARDLATQFGTPTFFIDEDHFRDRTRAWSKSLDLHFGESAGEVYYAAKAFICTDVARWIKEEGIGILARSHTVGYKSTNSTNALDCDPSRAIPGARTTSGTRVSMS
jgi:diaminopimelate decarboxylase